MKILIALAYWEGDRAMAIRLATFLADLEPKKSMLADFLLVNRFDCKPILPSVPGLSRKFNVFQWQSKNRVTGWPGGCNALWISTMEWATSMIQHKKTPAYKAIFTCEGDGGPVMADWIARMSQAWDDADVYVLGPMVGTRGGPLEEHINGNALFSGSVDFLRGALASAGSLPPSVGWDYALAGEFRRAGWADCPKMKSYYNSAVFTERQYNKMVADQLIWVHGDKSNSLVNFGRKNLLGQRG